MQNRGLLKYKVHHLFFWMMVFGVWYFLRYQDYATPEQAMQVTAVKVTDLALLIYLTNYLLIPHLFYKKRYAGFIAAFIVLIVSSSLLKMIVIGHLTGDGQMVHLTGDLKTRIYDNVIPHFFLVIAGAAVKLMFDYTRLQRRMAETAKEKAEAELNFLKSQINPHFLFNSLNAVYFLIDKSNTEARQSLHKFSDMLRYQLYELSGPQIPIEREISYLRDYVDLQKLRKDEHYAVNFHCPPEVKGFVIEPLLLAPFAENAFKHISHFTDRQNFIRLALQRSNGSFTFTVANSKEPGKTTEQHGGIGLTNVKRRLELLYPGRHHLHIDDQPDQYRVKLTLQLNEDETTDR
ncbi:MAG: histidine kinase [Chitinophagaceae bacterium]